MISGTAIPSNEINHLFNILSNFLLVKVDDLEIKRTTSALRYVNRRQKCILFKNCSSVCFEGYVVIFFQRKKLNEASTLEQLQSDNNF